MHLKINACALEDGRARDEKLNLINDAIARLGNDLTKHHEEM